MSYNMYEYRLHQIQILLNAYKKNEDTYSDEIKALKDEVTSILDDMKTLQ